MDFFLFFLFCKLRGHPAFRRVSGFSEPVVTKSHEVIFSLIMLNHSALFSCSTVAFFLEMARHMPILKF